MKTIFVVCTEGINCGCGMDGTSPSCAFENLEDAENYCQQFNAINNVPSAVVEDLDWDRRKAVIYKLNLYGGSVIYQSIV